MILKIKNYPDLKRNTILFITQWIMLFFSLSFSQTVQYSDSERISILLFRSVNRT